MEKITLGETYRDRITGFHGMATSITRYLYGCDRVRLETIDPGGRHSGEVKSEYFDILSLAEVPDGRSVNRKPDPTAAG